MTTKTTQLTRFATAYVLLALTQGAHAWAAEDCKKIISHPGQRKYCERSSRIQELQCTQRLKAFETSQAFQPIEPVFILDDVWRWDLASQNPGLAKRRFLEAETIGLFKDAAVPTAKEAADAYCMLQTNKTVIFNYEKTFGTPVDGSSVTATLVGDAATNEPMYAAAA